MAKKYIDAEKLKAEIEGQIEEEKNNIIEETALYYGARQQVRSKILHIIDSLQQEQQEVDLEEEMDRFFEEMPIQEHENIFEDTYQMIARHFYELGLKSK